MDDLIVGKDYYVSDGSLETAKLYKYAEHSKTTYIGNGKFGHTGTCVPLAWKYWVSADEESDLCADCPAKGDMVKCYQQDCKLHHSWYEKELLKHIEELQKEVKF